MDENKTIMEKIRESFTLQANNFESSNMNFSKKEYLEYTVKCMNLKPSDVVLEAAVGTCACVRSIAPYVKSVTCYDATSAMLEVGIKEAKDENLNNIKFIEGLVENMPFEDNQFDIVISRLAYQHFSDIKSAFKEMARVVKENGKSKTGFKPWLKDGEIYFWQRWLLLIGEKY